MPTPLTIQRVESSILPLIKNLLEAEHLPTQDIQEGMPLFYAKEGSAIITCGGYEQYGKIGLLRSVAIRSESQGKGLGKQWMMLLLEKAKELKLEDLYLLTTTAEGFFTKIGFTSISRENVPDVIENSQEFSSICPSSAVLMHLKL